MANDAFLHTLCPACMEEVDAPITQIAENHTIRGENILVDTPVLVCPQCGTHMHDSRLPDGFAMANDEYRKAHGVPTSVELVGLRNRFGLSQHALAAILGLGEITIHRYEHGSLPTEPHMELLRKAKQPQYLLQRLEQKPKSLSDRSAQRAKTSLLNAVDSISWHCIPWPYDDVLDSFSLIPLNELNGYRKFEENRARELFVYLAQNVNSLFVTKFNKALFYLDFLSYERTSQGLTGLRYARLPYGPAPNEYDGLLSCFIDNDSLTYKEVGDGRIIEPLRPANMKEFLACEIAMIDEVVSFLNNFSSTADLSEYSHKEQAWRDVETGSLISYRYADSLSLR